MSCQQCFGGSDQATAVIIFLLAQPVEIMVVMCSYLLETQLLHFTFRVTPTVYFQMILVLAAEGGVGGRSGGVILNHLGP